MKLKKIIKIFLISLFGLFLLFCLYNYFSYKKQKNVYSNLNQNIGGYSVSIYYSPVCFPLFFATHPWVVINSPEYGQERFDIHSVKNEERNDYLYINSKKFDTGMSLFALPGVWYSKLSYKGVILYHEEGDHLKETVLNIHNSVYGYPYKDTYVLTPGPNSNSFVSWIINNFLSDKNINLPFNSFGKNIK